MRKRITVVGYGGQGGWHGDHAMKSDAVDAGIYDSKPVHDEITTDSYTVPRPSSDVHDFYRNLVRAINGKEEQLVKHCEVRRILKVMEAAFESDEKGSMPVAFDEEK